MPNAPPGREEFTTALGGERRGRGDDHEHDVDTARTVPKTTPTVTTSPSTLTATAASSTGTTTTVPDKSSTSRPRRQEKSYAFVPRRFSGTPLEHASFSSIAFTTNSIMDVLAVMQCSFRSVDSRAMAPWLRRRTTRDEQCGTCGSACSFAARRYRGIGPTRRRDAEGESREARRVQRAHLSALREEDTRAGPLPARASVPTSGARTEDGCAGTRTSHALRSRPDPAGLSATGAVLRAASPACPARDSASAWAPGVA